MKNLLLSIPLVFVGLGCGTPYRVSVNGFSVTGDALKIPQASSIFVLQNNNAQNPIFEREIGLKIQKLLNTKGYSIGTETANYYLLFEYGIDSGRTFTGSKPIYHPGGTATMQTFGSYGESSFSTIQTPGHATYVPYSEVVYTRWLALKLIDGNAYRSAQKVDPSWIGEVRSSGTSSDLRKVINYMLVAAFKHFGENTGEQVDEVILGGDSRVKALAEH